MFLAYLAIGFLILVGVLALMRAYAEADPTKLAKLVRGAAIGSAALGAALILLRVPFGFVLLLVGAALPLALQWRALWPQSRGSDSKAQARTSRIDTKNLSMVLDHASGTLDGRVLGGRYLGRRLAELTLDQVLEVRAECQADDPDGLPLIEAYLDRIHGTGWRTGPAGGGAGDAGAPRPSSTMTREEAYAILGLEPGASDADIREAHRRLMMKLHPDQGGSNYLAAKINQAKDLLVGA
jgi:hypothetical protein